MNWFATWRTPQYREWAQSIRGGYVLLIVHQTHGSFLCARAKLLMRRSGLPELKLLEQRHFPTRGEAMTQIRTWKREATTA